MVRAGILQRSGQKMYRYLIACAGKRATEFIANM
ncbi:hypothetical protein CKO_02274 [Citrobacter koseri ATCC BAA-895]|uniref:Uncharacterized protein n=1 Tax=Citrobacter koseri (strain ATCC BAA-895 / CDC 4225-83 / SGSC4696) TaxID=290338 RepID=A8AIT3_CITK8|nr:hypothetical protein CKO_02274 [Citrobacter koseri ATCC BAA-895]